MWRLHPVVSRLVAGFALMVAPFAVDAAHALDPDDTPWTVEDDSPGQPPPASIEELLERDRLTIIEDHDVPLPSQDQPDYVANPGPEHEDRLAPKLPDIIHQAIERAPPDAPLPAAGPQTPPASVTGPVQAPAAGSVVLAPSQGPPDPLRGPLPQALTPQPGNVPTAAQLTPAPAPRTPVITAPAPRLAIRTAPRARPPETAARAAPPPQTLTPAAPSPSLLRSPPPADAAVATDGYDPSAPPPLAVPSEPVSQGAIAVNGKLYLPLARALETRGETDLAVFGARDRAALLDHYRKSVGEALWVTRSGYTPAAAALVQEISQAGAWGLESADYPVASLPSSGGDIAYETLTDAELKLSLAALAYARHARGDRIADPSTQLSSFLDRKPQTSEPEKILAALLTAPDKAAYLRDQHPKHAQFTHLRNLLASVRKKQAEGAEPERIPDGPKITPGKKHSHIAILRRRLGLATPLDADGRTRDETVYDDALASAVVAYKRKHGIDPDNATVTADLRRSLNKQSHLDEGAIIANMEQWRWMPDDLGDVHIWVNIPEFLVRVKRSGEVVHEERVIAGRYETQTPVFSNRLRTVVFQPSWNVPESIKVNELLPGLKAGSNPVARQGLRMERNGREVDAWNVDWQRQDIRNYHIYQPPGPSNVLGVVKFLFPNKHAVYLHDTPTKRLFNETLRTYSHGCVRVRDPVRLAEVVMAIDKGWDPAAVRGLISDGPEDNDVALDTPIPVHMTYFTVWAAGNGEVQTFPDIYGHEKRIRLGLNGRWEELAQDKAHIAPAVPVTASTREDWGDLDDETAPRRVRKVRSRPKVSLRQARPAVRQAAQRASPVYRQAPPKKPPNSSLFTNIFATD